MLRGLLAEAIWTIERAARHELRADSRCDAPTETGRTGAVGVPRMGGARDPWLPWVLRVATAIPGLGRPDTWPPCLRRVGFLPRSLVQGVGREEVFDFMRRLYGMDLANLAARLSKHMEEEPPPDRQVFPQYSQLGALRQPFPWA